MHRAGSVLDRAANHVDGVVRISGRRGARSDAARCARSRSLSLGMGIGVHAVVAGTVTSRAAEIGGRLALGATPGRVVSEVMSGTMWRIAVGTAAGGAVAAGLCVRTRASSLEAMTFAAAPMLLLSVALVASWWPGRRAAPIDPGAALRVQ